MDALLSAIMLNRTNIKYMKEEIGINKQECKEALLRGQGRCIQAIQQQPDRYQDVVLWACSHEVAFDPQCEGTRAWFVYQLMQCYPDPTIFLSKAIHSLEKAVSKGGWKLLYLAELLDYFSADDHLMAHQALWKTYETMYVKLNAKTEVSGQLSCKQEDFEMLCMVLAKSKKDVVRIVGDIGRYYQKHPNCDGTDFAWFYDSKVRRYQTYLEQKAKHEQHIALYLEVSLLHEKTWKQTLDHKSVQRQGVALSLWLKKQDDPAILDEYVSAYLNQSDPQLRAQALRVFWRCPYPADVSALLHDACFHHEELRHAAYEALKMIRHPLVREFALQQVQKGNMDGVILLIKNYQKEDANILEEIGRAIPVDRRADSQWHGFHLAVLHMIKDGFSPPASLLNHIYETSYCSCCREYAVRQMGRRRLLNEKMMKECVYDSNEELRIYAKQWLKRKQVR